MIPIFQVNAFTDELFCGNPACVVLVREWPTDGVLKKIAKENAVAETAFLQMTDKEFILRWFTPEIEMDLCGHATLATAHVLSELFGMGKNGFDFHTCSGIINVKKELDFYQLDLPCRTPEIAILPSIISQGLSIQPGEVLKSRDYILIYPTEEHIRQLVASPSILGQINLDPGGICITAPGLEVDFVSRFFTPGASIFEDPVTGSAHCSLVPLWAERLNKKSLTARQISERGGYLECGLSCGRVQLKGKAITYSKGMLSNSFGSLSLK